MHVWCYPDVWRNKQVSTTQERFIVSFNIGYIHAMGHPLNTYLKENAQGTGKNVVS